MGLCPEAGLRFNIVFATALGFCAVRVGAAGTGFALTGALQAEAVRMFTRTPGTGMTVGKADDSSSSTISM